MALPLGHDGREFDGNHQPFVPPGTAGRRGGVRSISKTGWIAGVESHFYLGEQLLDRRSTRILRAVQKQRGQADQKQPFFHTKISPQDFHSLLFAIGPGFGRGFRRFVNRRRNRIRLRRFDGSFHAAFELTGHGGGGVVVPVAVADQRGKDQRQKEKNTGS